MESATDPLMKETDTTMEELIERLEKATGPWRMLDVGIFNATTGRKVLLSAESGLLVEGEVTLYNGTVPAYTSSIDAALTLAPESANSHGYDLGPSEIAAWFSRNYVQDGHWHVEAYGKTPALALCIAALRARQA